jgi:hypothetical protein
MLHHFLALVEVLSAVVRRPHFVLFTMRQLAFDHICAKPLLIQDRAGDCSEPVPITLLCRFS